MRAGRGSANALPSTGWISICLIFIFAQMSASLILFAAEFIQGPDVLISPFRTCRICGLGEPCCGPSSAAWIRVLLVLSLYVPVVLVAFALLATLLAAHAKDGGLQRLSLVCQVASGLLLLTGTMVFLVINRAHVTWESMTPWFYTCMGVQVELALTSVLTHLSARRMKPDLEWNHSWISAGTGRKSVSSHGPKGKQSV